MRRQSVSQGSDGAQHCSPRLCCVHLCSEALHASLSKDPLMGLWGQAAFRMFNAISFAGSLTVISAAFSLTCAPVLPPSSSRSCYLWPESMPSAA